MTTQPRTDRRRIRIACKAAGLAFCLIWAGAVLAFPVLKDMLAGYAPVLVGGLVGGLLCLRPVRGALDRRLAGLSQAKFLAAVLILAAVLRVVSLLIFPMAPKSDPGFFHKYAGQMARGQEYGEPGARAQYPPGMSLLLAGLYAATGPSVLAAKLLNLLLSLAVVLLIYDVGRMVASASAARWAAVLAAVMPTLVFYSACLGYETLLACILLAVCDLLLRSRRGGLAGLAMAAAVGLLLGFGALVKPICLLMPILCLIGWLALGPARRALACTALCVVFMAGPIAPWTVRNYRVFGRFVLISLNAGTVLWAANNPDSDGLYMPDKPRGDIDEVRKDREARAEALKWIRRNPGDFARLAVRKAVITWGTSSTVVAVLSMDRMDPRLENLCKAAVNVFWTMLLVLCLVGTLTTGTWSNRLLWPMHLMLLYVFALHLVFEALSRHHIPVLGSLLILAGVTLAQNAQGARDPR